MSRTTLSQSQQLLSIVSHSGINRKDFQDLLESSRLSILLHEFKSQINHSGPTITPIHLPIDHGRTLVERRDAGKYDYVIPDFSDAHFPLEADEEVEREFVLVCFHREMEDNENPAKSELLCELDRMDLRPEGPVALCAVGEHHPRLQKNFFIVARKQLWRAIDGDIVCPVLGRLQRMRLIQLCDIRYGWDMADYQFLASRKPKAK